jgi:hypothetical protein
MTPAVVSLSGHFLAIDKIIPLNGERPRNLRREGFRNGSRRMARATDASVRSSALVSNREQLAWL